MVKRTGDEGITGTGADAGSASGALWATPGLSPSPARQRLAPPEPGSWFPGHGVVSLDERNLISSHRASPSTIDVAFLTPGMLVEPAGENWRFFIFSTNHSRGTPACRATEMLMDRASSRPEMVLPILSAFRKISPG